MGEPNGRKRDLALKLASVARRLRLRFDQRTERIGISRAQWGALAVVAHHPGATQRTIANFLEVTEVTAGRLIDRLCAEGYLERYENPDDRRAYRVFMTKAAHPKLEKLGKLAAVYEEEIFAGFSREDLAKLSELLSLMDTNAAKPLAGKSKRCT